MGSTLAGTFIVIVLMLDIAYLLVDRSIERKKRIEAEGKRIGGFGSTSK